MKKLLNKLLITIMIVILIFNFVLITPSKAVILDGGILMKPFSTFALLILDNIAFAITMAVGVMSNGGIDWLQDWGQDALNALQDSWATDESLINNADSTLETALEITGMGFLTMEDFFRGELEISNINIFNSMPSGNVIENIFDDTRNNENSVINAVKISVASWYYALRNIAAVGLLCALIYIAIRILLSTVAEDKAHYKDLLMDWVKAVCLVLFAHVLMMIILNVTENIVVILKEMTSRYSSIAWVRAKLIMDWNATQIMYVIMYGMLIYYTICFAISYTKRFLYTMLLIIIAPIVALVYAFGKEGKEIFNKWLKEFTLNAFLQPYHMVIYTVLFGFVTSIAEQSNGLNSIYITIYSLIVLHFIKDAEKYYRALFGMGAGVAGIGQVDTGSKTVEKVVKKTTQVVSSIGKVALSVAALAIPGGSVLNGAVNAAQTAQAANAANTAQDLGNIASGFGGGNPPDPDGGILPEGPDDPNGGPGGGSADYEDIELDPADAEDWDGDDGPDGGLGGYNDIELDPADAEDWDGDDGPDGGLGGYNDIELDPADAEDWDGDDGSQNASGQNLDVATITAQNLESGQAEINKMNAGDIHAISANEQNPKNVLTREERIMMGIGGVADAITGTNLGSNLAETGIEAKRGYNLYSALGHDEKSAALKGLDDAINGKGNTVGGIYTVNGQTGNNPGQGNTTDTIIDNSSLNSSATIGIEDNSTRRLEAKQEIESRQETSVKPASVSGGTVTTTQGKSDKALAEMIATIVQDTMPEIPSDIAREISGDVAKELLDNNMNNIDMDDFKKVVTDVMGKADIKVDGAKVTNVQNIANITEGGSESGTADKSNGMNILPDDQSSRTSDDTAPRITDGQ